MTRATIQQACDPLTPIGLSLSPVFSLMDGMRAALRRLRRLSVVSRPTLYRAPRSGIDRALHSSHRIEPSAQMTRASNPTSSPPLRELPSAPRAGSTSSGWRMSRAVRRAELRLRIAQEAHERRVHALELAVEAHDGQRVDREVDLLSFPRLSPT
jgi:hypothetical protein